jgi:hypothetical protein
MNILRLAVEVFLLYLLLKLIFDFIIPVYQTSKKVKRQFGEMQSKMDEQMNQFNRQNGQRTQTTTSAKPEKKKEEYIDYEEIKD